MTDPTSPGARPSEPPGAGAEPSPNAGPAARLAAHDPPELAAALAALAAYFAGDLTAIDRLPTAPHGTAFQREVWAALRTIPAGATWTYAALAAAVGRPSAVRAVGLANARNPVAVVIPCHRVIGRDGSLTGYAGGLERKRWLLRHEGALLL